MSHVRHIICITNLFNFLFDFFDFFNSKGLTVFAIRSYSALHAKCTLHVQHTISLREYRGSDMPASVAVEEERCVQRVRAPRRFTTTVTAVISPCREELFRCGAFGRF